MGTNLEAGHGHKRLSTHGITATTFLGVTLGMNLVVSAFGCGTLLGSASIFVREPDSAVDTSQRYMCNYSDCVFSSNLYLETWSQPHRLYCQWRHGVLGLVTSTEVEAVVVRSQENKYVIIPVLEAIESIKRVDQTGFECPH